MIIHSYIMTNPDEVPVLPDAINSLAEFSDKIYLVDGGLGGGTLNHHPTLTKKIADVFYEWIGISEFFTYRTIEDGEEYTGIWWHKGKPIPLTLYNHEFKDPGNQRNWLTKKMESEIEQPDWYCWIDSDEVCSEEFIMGIRPFLATLPNDATNVVPKWLTLVQDESHIVQHMSSWLAHGRVYRPHTIYWNSGWHEHQYYEGKRVQFDTRIIHTRALFRRRLYVQRGHPMVAGRDNPLWGDAVMVDVPQGIKWTLHWPEGEVPIPFDADIREFEGGRYARPNSDNL